MKKLILAIAAVFCAVAAAQNHGTGAYSHATLDNRGFDQVNVGNLNVRFSIPIVSKAGRGLPFNYALQYEGLIWAPTTANGTTTWVPDPNWGFTGTLNGSGVTGFLTYQYEVIACNLGPGMNGHYPAQTYANAYINYAYHDAFGAVHSFPGYSYQGYCQYGPTGGPYGNPVASDGSGYTMIGQSSLKTSNGIAIAPTAILNGGSSANAGGETDANGNSISFNGSGTYTDTTGTTELQITGSNPVQFTYPVTLQANNATSASAYLYYRSYIVRSNFGCPGVGEYGSNTVALVDHVTLADGSTTYSFSYEGTPGATDGAVTGRLASVILPTRGTIRYSYSGGCGSGSGSGILGDGSQGPLTRTTSDGSRIYDRTNFSSNGNSGTIYDEQGNQTFYDFTVDSTTGNYFETDRQVYQGAQSGIPLQETFTCYNGATAPCNRHALSLPITEADITQQYNGIGPVLTKNTYDSQGNYITLSTVQTGSGLLTQTLNSYFAPGPVTELTSTKAMDGNGNVISYTSYGYDETSPIGTSGLPQHSAPSANPGNQTSVHVSIDGSTTNTLNTSTGYFDTGMTATTNDPGGFQTKYGYEPTGTFQTTATLPTLSSGVGLSTSAAYDVASGVAKSVTGMNQGQTFTIGQYDPLLRPTLVTSPEGGQSETTYTPNQISAKTQISGSQWADTETYLDAYGRTVRTAVQSSSGWYITDFCYVNGVLRSQSTPYANTSTSNPSSTNCASSNATQYGYDALGRKSSVATPDGYSQTIQYNGRAVQTSDTNGVSRITQYDSLGQVSAVCEVSSNSLISSGSPGSCNTDFGGNGYLTTYAYNLAGHSVTMTQGTQARTFTTDAAGRLTFSQEPETWITTYSYSYQPAGLQVQRTRPQANQSSRSTTTITTTQYDKIGRVISISYNDGTPTKTFGYDHFTDGSALGYSLGQMTYANTSGSGGLIEQQSRSYDIMGRVSTLAECLPQWCSGSQNYVETYTYDLASLPYTTQFSTALGNSSTAQLTYMYNTAGQTTYINSTLGSGSNGTSYYNTDPSSMTPFGPQLEETGNSLYTAYSYDPAGHLNQGWTCANSAQLNCTGGQTVYAYTLTTQGNQVKQAGDYNLGPVRQFQYDEFGRLKSVNSVPNSSPAFGMTFAYDRYGNRWQQNVTAGSGPSPQLSFNTANQINSQGYSYDAAGNMIGDGTNTYRYDAENNLIAIGGSNTATYGYNALNQRDIATWNNQTQRSGFDQNGRRTTGWSSTGALITNQFYANGKPYAYWSSTDGNIHFEHADWVGTERTRTTANGATEGTYLNYPFGEYEASSGNDLTFNHFAGLDADVGQGTGLSHAMFREYQATSGRWMSPDPYSDSYHWRNPQSFNRYSYVDDNPIANRDPYGLDIICTTTETYSVSYQWTYVSDGDYYDFVPVYTTTDTQSCIDTGNGGAPVPSPGGGASSGSYGGGYSQSQNPLPAPSNAHSDCVKQALLSNAASLSIDLAGAVVPGVKAFGTAGRLIGAERGFATIGRAYQGIVADQQGARAIKSLVNSAGAASGLAGATDTSPLGLASTFLSGASLIGGAYVPVLGQVLSGASFLVDAAKTYNAVQACPK